MQPQNNKVLKKLRLEQQNLSQNKMADALSQAFQEATGLRHVIQQPDVCRLENGSASIDIFKLLAYSYLCHVDISYLLQREYKNLLRNSGSDMHIKNFHADNEAEQRLLELEKKERLLISPEFPSSFFRLDKTSKRYQQLNSADYEANELYTIDSFINFLFSPVGQYTLDDKKAILEEYIRYFQNNNFRQLNFFPRSVLPKYSQLTFIELLPEQKMLLIPGPITHYGEGDTFIEVRDQAIYDAVTKFYRSLRTFENSMIYLRIGLEALERMRDGSPARDAITSFSIEIMRTRDLNAVEAIKCFSPEIQNMLNQ
ncbi:MAG: hypothetical protein ACPGSM_12300 [Thiolinea sp.]